MRRRSAATAATSRSPRVATNLVAGDTNTVSDVFVRDRSLGTTTRTSVTSINNAQANEASDQPSISADGRYLAFSSFASNLIGSFDTSTNRDIFLRENATSNTVGFTFDANGDSSHPSIGLNSALPVIAYESTATNLVPNDTNGVTDVFVQDYFPFTLRTRVSTDVGGAQATGTSYGAALSSDGRYAGFRSQAPNLVTGDTNGGDDVFLHFAHPPVVNDIADPSSLPRGAVHQTVQIFGGNLENPAVGVARRRGHRALGDVQQPGAADPRRQRRRRPRRSAAATSTSRRSAAGPGITAGGRAICAGCFAVT